MNAETLLNSLRVIELEASSREVALQQLVAAGEWAERGIADATLLAAIEEREAHAQTIVAEGLAIPHATLAWDGACSIVMGRCREGVEYGAAGERVSLIVLVITGNDQAQLHLEILSLLGKLLIGAEFRKTLIEADCVDAIQLALRRQAGLDAPAVIPAAPSVRQLSGLLARHAVDLAGALRAQAILVATDRLEFVPWDALRQWQRRLLVVSGESGDPSDRCGEDVHFFDVPHADLSRMDRANLGILLAASDDLLTDASPVVCITGQADQPMDCIAVIRPPERIHAVFRNHGDDDCKIAPAVILRVLSIAIELSAEGREGKPVGAMFVVGDTRQVQRRARQLVLNPFHGFSRRMRSILDPGLTETIKEFATIDGAFVIRSDGTIRSAGTYIISESSAQALTGGLGARHQAALSITEQTKATAITVSQSTGAVSVFQNGNHVLTLERGSLTRW